MAGQRKINPTRNYLAKDYSALKNDLLKYAKTFFADKIQDFSEASVGGLLLDMAASVGDNMSFYLDHQFRETLWSDAVEISNIERMIRNSGVKIVGASPSTVDVTFYIEVPAVEESGRREPDRSSLPIIQEGTVLSSRDGVPFSTIENLDFAETDKFGNLSASVIVGDVDSSGQPITFILSKNITAVSGRIYVEAFNFGPEYVPYRTITLNNTDISEIISVVDSGGDEWYEVESLTQDTAYVGIININDDKNIVKKNLKIVPAPKRFITSTDLQSRTMRLQFGSGDPSLLDDDVFPDPSKLVVPLYGRKTISRFSIDPNSLLKSRTMGIAPASTTLIVTYRAGGGTQHNVSSNSIRSIKTLRIDFKNGATASVASSVRASLDVTNQTPATGGGTAPTIDELRSLIPAARNMQSRIVTKIDLLSRVYSLPSKFGSVYRAGIRQNPNNPLSTQLFVLSKDNSGRLIVSPDTLKQNLRTYINEYRLISDAIDIVDAAIVNYTISISIIPAPDVNVADVIKNVISSVQTLLDTRKIQIDQPIIIADIMSTIINVPGVLSLTRLEFFSLNGTHDGREYSNVFFDIQSNIIKGLIVGPPGSIFELKYPNFDIVVSTN
jgi:hypothetical protein